MNLKFDIMARNFFEDRMNDLYESVADGNLENYYALEEYLSENGYREGFYGEPEASCDFESVKMY